jgi:hypothetical protein
MTTRSGCTTRCTSSCAHRRRSRIYLLPRGFLSNGSISQASDQLSTKYTRPHGNANRFNFITPTSSIFDHRIARTSRLATKLEPHQRRIRHRSPKSCTEARVVTNAAKRIIGIGSTHVQAGALETKPQKNNAKATGMESITNRGVCRGMSHLACHFLRVFTKSLPARG